MKYEYEELTVKGNLLLQQGILLLPDTGVYVLTGENGSGKTLFLTRMHVELEAESCLMSQFCEPLPKLNALQNISLCLTDEKEKEIRALLEQYGIEALLQRKPASMSGGEARLLSFLRCLFSGAKILLLDEPTNDLDYAITETLIAIIRDYAPHRLFLIVTHDSRVKAVADGALHLADRQLRLCGALPAEQFASLEVAEQAEKSLFDDRIVGKLWNKGAIVGLILLLVCVTAIYLTWTADDGMPFWESDIPIDEAAVFSITASNHSLASLSVEALLALTGEMTDAGTEENTIPSLVLTSTEHVQVYPLEFRVQEERMNISTLNVYVESVLHLDCYDNYVDTTDVIYTKQDCPDFSTAHPFEPEAFEEALRLIQEEYPTAKPIYYGVKYEDSAEFERFLAEQIPPKDRKSVYVLSQKTIELANQLAQVERYNFVFSQMASLCLLLLTVELIFLFLYIRAKRRQLRLLFNCNVEAKRLQKTLVRKNNALCFRLGATLLAFAAAIAMMLSTPEIVFAKLLPISWIVLFNLVGYFGEKILLKISLKRIASHQYRD